jgi:ATP-binding cassette subfamily B protein
MGRTSAQPGWLRRLGAQVLVHRRDVVLSLLAAVLGSACQAVVPLLERTVVDDVVVRRSGPLWPWLLALLLLAAAVFGFAYVRRFHGGRVAVAVQTDLRNAMHAHLQRLDFAALDRMPTGQVVARATSDAALVQGLLSFLPLMSGNLLLMLLSLGVMVWLSPLLALVSLVIVPAGLLVSYRLRSAVFPATWDAQQREGDLVQIVDEDVNGVRVVKAFGQEGRELGRVAAAAGTLYGAQLRAVRLQARYQPLLQAIPTLGQVAILALGGWLALRGQLTLGTFLAFSTYVGQLLAPARQLAGVLTIGQQARAGVERIQQLLDLEPAVADRPDAVVLPPATGTGSAITFRDVHAGYGDGPDVLRGFDLHVAAGERVALVGPSGSGTSTATLLVPRCYDVRSGAVLVDGHDVRTLALDSLRGRVGIVFEESFLFSDSVRANIAYGRPDATDAEVEAAARAVGAHDVVAALPGGYRHEVSERGRSLSGGQRQLLALARAELVDPVVLLLDEATSNLDLLTEARVARAMQRVSRGRTTVVIAHRLQTARTADRIAVLAGGRVAELGSHEELLALGGRYAAMWQAYEELGGGRPALAS